MEDLENQEKYEFDFLDEKEEKKEKNNSLKIGMGILLILLLAIGGYYFFGNNKATEETNVEEITAEEVVGSNVEQTQDSINNYETVSDTINNQLDETTNDSLQESYDNTDAVENDNLTTPSENSVNTPVNDNGLVYFIVSNAFQNADNANKEVARLQQAGYQALIAGQNKSGLYIVAYEGFSDIENAKTKLKEIRQQDTIAWIYKKQ